MPTYAYACTVCDHTFDAVQKFTDDALTDCPQCDGLVRKQFNAVGVVFKGSGFYRTDSRREGGGKTASSTSSAASKNSSSSQGSSASSSSSSSSSSSTSSSSTSSSSPSSS